MLLISNSEEKELPRCLCGAEAEVIGDEVTCSDPGCPMRVSFERPGLNRRKRAMEAWRNAMTYDKEETILAAFNECQENVEKLDGEIDRIIRIEPYGVFYAAPKRPHPLDSDRFIEMDRRELQMIRDEKVERLKKERARLKKLAKILSDMED